MATGQHEIRYEKGSSRYRVLTVRPERAQDAIGLFYVRTAVSPKGLMDTEKFIAQHGLCLDLYADTQNERYYQRLTKREVRNRVKEWRRGCKYAGLTLSKVWVEE